MTARTKSTLLLLASLLLGIVLGALGHARLSQARFERMASVQTARGFVHYMERAIPVRDAEQARAVRAVLDSVAQEIAATSMEHRQEMAAHLAGLREALAPVLTEQQLRQMERELRFQRMERQHRDRRRPGPPGGRPMPPPGR